MGQKFLATLAVAASLILTGAWCSSAAYAQTAGGVTPGSAEDLDEKADAVFRRMSDFLKDQGNIVIKAFSFFDERTSGLKSKRFIVHDIALIRPNRLRFRSTFDSGAVTEGWYDGKTLTLASPTNKTYAQVPFDGTIDEMLDTLQDKLGVSIPIADALYTDIYAAQIPFILSSAHLGERTLRGRTLDHLTFEGLGADWQMWVETGQKPVPRRLVIHYFRAAGQPEYVITFDEWAFGTAKDGDFAAVIPDDWKRIETATK